MFKSKSLWWISGALALIVLVAIANLLNTRYGSWGAVWDAALIQLGL